MKVVYLNPSGQLGGAEVALLDLLASVRDAYPSWTLELITGADGPLISRAEELGVKAKVLPFPRAVATLGDAGAGGPAGSQRSRASLVKNLATAVLPTIGYLKTLRREFRRSQPDLLHTNGFKMHVLGVRARSANKTAVIWHIRDYVSTRPLMARLLQRHKSQAAAAITNSQSVAEDLRAVCGNELKIYPLHDAIDLEKFSPVGETIDLDARSGLPPAAPGTVRVGLLATMARWKGHEVFLRALSSIPAGVKVRGYIIGDALYQTVGSQHSIAGLRRVADELELGQRVGFTGYIEDASSVMRSLDIVVHASTQPEPFGLVIAEAMACGRALIASNAGGAAEIIKPGTDSLAHQPCDFKELADCIVKLATDRGLRERLGENGRLKARSQFDRARLATQIAPIYQEALSQKT